MVFSERSPERTPAKIAERAEKARKSRGLTYEQLAARMGCSASTAWKYLHGKFRFTERGALEALAAALRVTVADLTGQTVSSDSMVADAIAILMPISAAFAEATWDDVPDMAPRSVSALAKAASEANARCADSLYFLAGTDMSDLVIESMVHAVAGSGEQQAAALRVVHEASLAAAGIARSLNNPDLALTAATRAHDAAIRLEDPALAAFANMTRVGTLSRIPARGAATRTADKAIAAVERFADPSAEDPRAAEALGMLHLSRAHIAAKNKDGSTARDHWSAARELAQHTGERNTLWYSFGPANVRAWELGGAVELGNGVEVAERIEAIPGYAQALYAADRKGALHFDLAKAYASAVNGTRDLAAIRHFDLAVQAAPQRIRLDPTASELLDVLDERAPVSSFALSSLKSRLRPS
ncbi:helix-turn-helix transcriptional regulator [Kutzneria sp. 744]|uniref:helix-turn-helix domain-containing protein n=1 Tax=Kutzneria sp. (strain 744) TaxID=345341 RepID=UPI0005B9330D|nr:helix-turn-helix transcriptional regulator [Kutzneria sp. 744]